MQVADQKFNVLKDSLIPKDGDSSMVGLLKSENITCHAFDKAGKLHLCTEAGEIIICDYDGTMQFYLRDAPFGERLECIYPASRGLIVAGNNGYIYSYENKSFEYGAPYAILQSKIGFDENAPPVVNDKEDITSICLSEPEDQIYTINKNNQLQTIKFSYDREKSTGSEAPRMHPLHTMFHSNCITGMDICLRKQLIVTTSDKHIYIWNYNTKQLEIAHTCQGGEIASAVAFHPSGFHIVVAFGDKIQFMNVLSNSIKEYSTGIPIKGCREIRFSNGGHMFACAVGASGIYIYNFYTQECPQNMMCKGHSQKVRCIDWYDDDMGFASCAQDGTAYFYDLQTQKEQQSRIIDRDFNQKGVRFTGLCNIPNQ
jgi:WD40 repeat protein